MKNVLAVRWIGHKPTKLGIEVRVLTGTPYGAVADVVIAAD